MSSVLRRVALVSAIVMLGLVAVVGAVSAAVVAARDIEGGAVVVGACVVVAAVVAGIVVVRYADRESTVLARHLTALADRAERLGTDDPAGAHPAVGIPEIDGVGTALTASARTLLDTLSSERDFAADASHQLRTPLTALLMRLEEIGTTQDIDTVREEAAVAIEQAERLDATVATLLARSRRTREALRGVRVDQVLALLQRHWQPRFERDHRSVAVTGARGVDVVASDAALEQILGTLLENALVHGDGTVTVDVRHSGPSVVIEVVDEGEGMTAGISRRAFERHVSTKSSGIGLAVARDLAERYGGRLELVDPRPARFALFLSSAEGTAGTVDEMAGGAARRA